MAKAKKSLVVNHFESVSSLLNEARQDSACSEYLTSTDSWRGMPGGGAALIEALPFGYDVVRERVDAFQADMDATLPTAIGLGRRRVLGPQGGHLNVHAVLSGHLSTAWTSRHRAIRPGKLAIQLIVDICDNAGASQDSLIWRGLAGAALAKIMQKAGYSVEILAGMGLMPYYDGEHHADARMIVTIAVKPAMAQIDNNFLSVTICNAAFFRSLGFSAIVLSAKKAGKKLTSGLGTARGLDGLIPVNSNITQLCVPMIDNRDAAIKWVKETVALLQGAK